MTDSQTLLAEYTRNGSESAFRELVTRYLGLVYSTALRLVGGDTHLAEDVAQTVFMDLSRNARNLSSEVMLGGWLHQRTFNVAAPMMRAARRRQSREREAVQMSAMSDHSTTDFDQIAPLLDEALTKLGKDDRTAILLRFFEQHDFRSVGQALGINEDAARMRVSRALEKLEVLLKRRGVTTTAATLSVVLAANAVQAAPVGLAVTISTAAALGGTTFATTATATATKTIAMTTMQKTVIGATLAAAVGTGIYEAHQASSIQSQVQVLRQEQAPLSEQIQQLTGEKSDLSNKLAAADKKRFRWESVESTDYKQYIANLRAIGCPEQTIHDIIVADLDRTYWQRMTKARPESGKKYWQAPIPKLVWNKQNAEYTRLQFEKRAVLREFLGSDFEEPMRGGRSATYEEGFEFLSAEKRRQLREISHQASLKRIESEANGKDLSDEIKKWERAEIKQLLTPKEWDEYEMRWSSHSGGLAQMARAFEPSEQEFRSIFQTEKQFGQDDYEWVYGTTGYAQRKPAEADTEAKFQAALKQALGEQRYMEYQRSLDPNYLILYDIARKDGLSKDTIVKAYELNRAAEQQATAFQSDVSFSAEGRQAALRQLEEETDKDIANLLGNAVLKRFRSGQRDAALYPAKHVR